MNAPRNPFILGHRIERPYFCDREEEQKNLRTAVTNGRNVVLISPRRMGKTSLVNVTLEDMKEKGDESQVFFFDILSTNSLSELTYLLGKEIFETLHNKLSTRLHDFLASLKSLKGTFGYDALSGTPTFNVQLGDIRNPEYTLEEIFQFIEESDRRVIVVIDEFQQITKYPEKNTEAVLRSHMQRMSNATFIFAGSEQSILQEMFVSSKRPFYNSSEIMHLGPIPEDKYVDFAQRLFEERGRRIDGDAVRWAFGLFEGNTFYVQRSMNGGFAETAEGGICGKETVERSIRGMLGGNEVMYREMLSNVTTIHKSVLLAVAKEGIVANPMSGMFIKKHALASTSSVQNSLQKLMKTGIVVKTGEGYKLSDPLFRIFVNGLYGVKEF